MGRLLYGPGEFALDVENDLLAHLKVVIATKLRRGEPFLLSWVPPTNIQAQSAGALWIHPGIPLRFVLDGPEPLLLSREVLDDLSKRAQLLAGLDISATPARATADTPVRPATGRESWTP